MLNKIAGRFVHLDWIIRKQSAEIVCLQFWFGPGAWGASHSE